MIVFDRKEKEIKVPEGLGNINLTVVDANLEDKTVEINEVETTILPSSGYNGMSSLQIDAQPVYDNGYNEGETVQKAKLTGITITENGTYSREDGYNEVVVDVPDLNGDYNEGYDAGKVDGYDSGYTAGETEQKSKLTNITISENGTYTREDGYNEVVVEVPDTNGSYDEGYQAGIDYAAGNAEEIAAANAIDLVATKFGTYYTKYSDNIVNPNPVTGIYPDGEKFYNYSIGKYYYDTGLQTSENTKIEIWFYNNGVDNFGQYYFQTTNLGHYSFALRIKAYGEGYRASIGASDIDFTLEVGWHHIAMSFADGLVVDGEKIGDFSGNILNTRTLLIGQNIDMSTKEMTIGMIKITTDGITNVIIPTENGFLNTTTNQLLEVVKDFDTYKYINNDPIILDNLIKSVDVQPKIDVNKYGIKFGQSTFVELPDFYDFSNVTDMSYMFQSCGSLQTMSLIDTSNATNMRYMFTGCRSLQTIPLIDTSNVTDMFNFFEACGSLQTFPELDTRKVTNMEYMCYGFSGLQNLVKLPKIHCDSCTTLYKFFAYNDNNKLNNLTDVGGWINLKCNFNGIGGLVCLPNLTYQSCINILNGLYDFTGNGETPASNQGQLKVHPNFLTTVGDEISIGVLKGWSISA